MLFLGAGASKALELPILYDLSRTLEEQIRDKRLKNIIRYIKRKIRDK
jgi:hypothetical protein